MKQYLDLLRRVRHEGKDREDRTGVGTRSLFGAQVRYDLRDGFPLVTTKKVFLKGVIHELLWMLRGSTDARELQAEGVRIWDEWATAEQCAKFGREAGDLGAIYGHHWRSFGVYPSHGDGVDQIARVVSDIKSHPTSRRLIVSAWDPFSADEVSLPCCHCLFQFYVHDGELSCQLYQRSGDVFLGVPWNIASYALLTHMIAQVTGLKPGEFIHTFGDVHLYRNHFEQADLQLSREPRPLPTMHLNPAVKDIFSFLYSDFLLEGYDPHPAIKAEVAV